MKYDDFKKLQSVQDISKNMFEVGYTLGEIESYLKHLHYLSRAGDTSGRDRVVKAN